MMMPKYLYLFSIPEVIVDLYWIGIWKGSACQLQNVTENQYMYYSKRATTESQVLFPKIQGNILDSELYMYGYKELSSDVMG